VVVATTGLFLVSWASRPRATSDSLKDSRQSAPGHQAGGLTLGRAPEIARGEATETAPSPVTGPRLLIAQPRDAGGIPVDIM